MKVTLRGCILAAGQIRRLWRQSINYAPARDEFSWTANGYTDVPPPTGGFEITRALRYKTQSLYMGQGIDNTRFAGLHTIIPPKVRHKPITLGVGLKRSVPTTRNRISSFGSRVPPLNPPVQAAEDQQ